MKIKPTDINGTIIVSQGGSGATTLTGYLKGNGTSAFTAVSTVPASDVSSGAALTKTDDTNVTLTLGGTPATSLLAATSLTLGWSGTLSVARGGTGGGTASGTLLDNISGFSSTGHLVRTASGTYAFRTQTGTSNRLTITNGDGVSGNPTFDISSSYVGQASITTLGTITTGTWTGTTIAVANGGTGSTTASTARTALGVAIGTDVQAYDADLTTWAGITPATGIGTFLSTPSSANLISAVTDETGTGALVFATSPTLVTPILGTPTSGTATNLTGLPLTTGVTGILPAANGGTGVNNTGTITLGGNLTTSGAFALTLTQTATTNVTLPTTGTLATLAGTETLTNKTLTSTKITTGLEPTTDDGAALGTTSKEFSDLFLASGGVINWANGNYALTHTTGNLTFSGGPLKLFGSGWTPVALSGTAPRLHITGNIDETARVVLDVLGDGTSTTANFIFRSARNTAGSPSALQSGDNLGQFAYFGYGATAYSAGARARILATTSQVWTDTAHGSQMSFSVTPNGTTTLTERVVLDNAGNFKPAVNDVGSLGTSALAFADLFLASGGVIDWNAGNVTLTHSSGTLTSTGSFAFSGTGLRIKGDFSDGTATNRLMYQTSVTNGTTTVGYLPNGTGTTAGVALYNATDPDNASRTQIITTATESSLRANASGTGTQLPLTLYTNGAEQARISTSGDIQMGGTNTVIDSNRINRLRQYTVATLPTAGTTGRLAAVTDALAPTFLATVVGGGTIKTPVYDNGTNWVGA